MRRFMMHGYGDADVPNPGDGKEYDYIYDKQEKRWLRLPGPLPEDYVPKRRSTKGRRIDPCSRGPARARGGIANADIASALRTGTYVLELGPTQSDSGFRGDIRGVVTKQPDGRVTYVGTFVVNAYGKRRVPGCKAQLRAGLIHVLFARLMNPFRWDPVDQVWRASSSGSLDDFTREIRFKAADFVPERRGPERRPPKVHWIANLIHPGYDEKQYVTDAMLEGNEQRMADYMRTNDVQDGDLFFIGSTYESRQEYGSGVFDKGDWVPQRDVYLESPEEIEAYYQGNFPIPGHSYKGVAQELWDKEYRFYFTHPDTW